MKLKLLTVALLLGSFLQAQEVTITTPTIKMVTSVNDLKSIKNPKSGDLTMVTNSSGVTKYLYDGSKWVSLSAGGSGEVYVGFTSDENFPTCPTGWTSVGTSKNFKYNKYVSGHYEYTIYTRICKKN